MVPLLQVVVIALVVLVIQLTQNLVSLDAGPVGIIRAQAEIFPAAVNELASGLAPMVVGARGTVVVIVLIALITLALDLMFIDLGWHTPTRSEEHTSELQSRGHLVCRLLLEK